MVTQSASPTLSSPRTGTILLPGGWYWAGRSPVDLHRGWSGGSSTFPPRSAPSPLLKGWVGLKHMLIQPPRHQPRFDYPITKKVLSQTKKSIHQRRITIIFQTYCSRSSDWVHIMSYYETKLHSTLFKRQMAILVHCNLGVVDLPWWIFKRIKKTSSVSEIPAPLSCSIVNHWRIKREY